jgi:hypothetical protein
LIGKHADLVRQCLELLHLHGALAWKTNAGAAWLPGRGGKPRPVRFNVPGTPDIVGCLKDGRFVGVECKVGKDRLSGPQLAFGTAIAERGGFFRVVRDAAVLDELLAMELART